MIAITCSWCKRSYHNKRSCFSLARFDDHCDRGPLRELLLPPGWLLRLGTQRRGHSQSQQKHQQQQPQRATSSGSFISRDRDQHTLKKSKRKVSRKFWVYFRNIFADFGHWNWFNISYRIAKKDGNPAIVNKSYGQKKSKIPNFWRGNFAELNNWYDVKSMILQKITGSVRENLNIFIFGALTLWLIVEISCSLAQMIAIDVENRIVLYMD